MNVASNQNIETVYKIHKAVSLLDKLSDQILQAQLNIGFSQFLVLMVLAQQSKVPQKFIVGYLSQTQAAVSRQVELLVRHGLVDRTRNLAARREYVLSLSKNGKKVFDQGMRILSQSYEKIFSVWNKSSKVNVLNEFNNLIMAIGEQGAVRKAKKSK